MGAFQVRSETFSSNTLGARAEEARIMAAASPYQCSGDHPNDVQQVEMRSDLSLNSNLLRETTVVVVFMYIISVLELELYTSNY